MHKKILIQTDFSLGSLDVLIKTLELFEKSSVTVVLVYVEELSSSISDLLFYSSGKIINAQISREYNDALQIIVNRYKACMQAPLVIEHYFGSNHNAFSNFISAQKITDAVRCSNFQLSHKRGSFCLMPYVNKSALKVIDLELDDKSISHTVKNNKN